MLHLFIVLAPQMECEKINCSSEEEKSEINYSPDIKMFPNVIIVSRQVKNYSRTINLIAGVKNTGVKV